MEKTIMKECVMLAAGLSSRMGKWKMMLPWNEGTILDSALDSALAFCDRIVLVTGFRGDELAAYYADHPAIEVVHNPDYQSGMFSSIRCGVSHIRASYFFLALGDMPEVTPAVYRALWASKAPDSCCIPVYDQGKGHPVLFAERAIALISHAADDVTLREVTGQMPIRRVPVSEQGVHWDVDTPLQYQQIAGRRLNA
ncbi:NTP transferase domain-containing protein [Salmonella enterica]|nr:CTP--molybdopterin cytidylyltransferase [Salmonella enterica]